MVEGASVQLTIQRFSKARGEERVEAWQLLTAVWKTLVKNDDKRNWEVSGVVRYWHLAGVWLCVDGAAGDLRSLLGAPLTAQSPAAMWSTTTRTNKNQCHLDFLHLGFPLGRAEVSHFPQVIVRGAVYLHHDVLVHHVLVRHLREVPPQLPRQSLQAVQVVLQVERTLRHLGPVVSSPPLPGKPFTLLSQVIVKSYSVK